MHAEFADQRIERHHLGGVIRRHLDGFLRGQNIELAGIENQAAVGPCRDRLPELADGVAGAAVDIDHAGVTLGAVTDEAVGVFAGEVDAERHAVDEIGVVDIDQPLGFMQRVEFIGVEDGVAGAEAHLREPRALAQQHRKSLRADLGIERAVIAGADHVEAPRAVRDHAGEDVEPPGRTLRIGGGDDLRRQRETFQQRHDVDAIGLQHRAVGEIDLVQLQLVDPLGHRRARAPAGNSRAPGRRCRRAADRGWPAGSGFRRTDTPAKSGRHPPSPRSCGRAECHWRRAKA